MPGNLLYRNECNGSHLIGASQYSQSGEYKILRGDSSWPLKPNFYQGDDSKPTCVIFPGYRMRGGAKGKTCNTLAGMLQPHGFSSLIVDYGGFTTGDTQTKDPATMTTNIGDARDAVDFLGDRPMFYIAMSYGLNVAMQIPRPNLKHIVAPAAAPDIVQRYIEPVLLKGDFNKASGGKDYIVAEFGEPMRLLFTRKYYEDARQYSAYAREIPPRAGISAIVAHEDPVVPDNLLPEWAHHMKLRGHFVKLTGIDKAGHDFAQHFLEAVVQETIQAARLYEQPVPIGP